MELLATGCGDGIWPRKGDWTDFWRKSPSQVTSHDGDVSSPGLKGRYLKMPDAGESWQETGLLLSPVLPEASGGATVKYKKLD